MLPVSPHIQKTLLDIDCLCAWQLSLEKTGVHQHKSPRPTVKHKVRKYQNTVVLVVFRSMCKPTFRFLQSNGQQLVPLRMPSYQSRARRLMEITCKLCLARGAYQGTEGRCQDRWGPQSLARWCNGSAKPLSPPLYPGGLAWPEHHLRANFIWTDLRVLTL